MQQKQSANHYDGSNGGDRYLSVTAFLLFLLAISVGVIWDRQSELNNAVDTNQILKNQVMDLLKEKADLLTAGKETLKWHGDPIIADLRQRVEELVRENEKLSLQQDTEMQTDHDSTAAEKESLNSQVLESTKKTERLETEAVRLGQKVSQLEQENKGNGIKYTECSDQLIIVLKDLGEVRRKVEDQHLENEKLNQEISQCNIQQVTPVHVVAAQPEHHHYHVGYHRHYHNNYKYRRYSGGGNNYRYGNGGNNYRYSGGGNNYRYGNGGNNYRYSGGGNNYRYGNGGNNYRYSGGANNYRYHGGGRYGGGSNYRHSGGSRYRR